MSSEHEIDQLIEALGTYRARARARRRLEELGEAAAPRLLDLLKADDSTANERWAAIGLLARCNHQPAIPAMIRTMRDDPTLRPEAARALRRLTGHDCGTDADQWERLCMPAASSTDTAQAPEPEAASARGESPREALVREAAADLADSITWSSGLCAHVTVAMDIGPPLDITVDFDRTNRKHEAVVCVSTDCGVATPVLQNIMFRHNVTLRHGVYATESVTDQPPRAVLRCVCDPRTLTPGHLRDVLLSIVNEVQQLRTEATTAEVTYPLRRRRTGGDTSIP